MTLDHLLLAALLAPLVVGCQHGAAHEGPEMVQWVYPTFAAKAVSPLAEPTPLQVVSVFPSEPGETLLTPATELVAFLGDARAAHGFGAEPLKTLNVSPKPAAIKADALLAVAWGPRVAFSPARAVEMGHAVMRETLKLGVPSMAYAPIARDQGVTSLPADAVAESFARGAMAELVHEAKTGPPASLKLRDVTYEAGPQFVDAVSKALARGVTEGLADEGVGPRVSSP